MMSSTTRRPPTILPALYAIAALGCLALALAPLEDLVRAGLRIASTDRYDFALVRFALVAASAGLIVLAIRARTWPTSTNDDLLFHSVLILCVVHAGALAVEIYKNLGRLVPHSWSEQVVVLAAARSRGITGLYSAVNLETPPFISMPYPPLFSGALELLAPFNGGAPTAARALSIGAILGAAALLGLMAAGMTLRFGAGLAVLLFLAMMPLLGWSSLVRPDFLAAFLSIAAVAMFLVRGLNGRSWIAASAVLGGLAMLTKPTAIAGGVTIATYLVWNRRVGEAVRLGALTLAIFLGTYAILWLPTDGGMWTMTVAGNASELDFPKIYQFGFRTYLRNPFIILALGSSFLLLWRSRKARPPRETFAGLYFLVSFGLGLLSLARVGSNHNYLFEAVAAGALAVTAALASLARDRNRLVGRVGAALLAVSLAGLFLQQFQLASRRFDTHGHELAVARLSELRLGPGEYVLSDPQYTQDTVDAGLEPLVLDGLYYTLLAEKGRAKVEPVVRLMRDGRVSYLVLQATPEDQIGRPLGARYWPDTILREMTHLFDCAEAIERPIDGRPLIICVPKA